MREAPHPGDLPFGGRHGQDARNPADPRTFATSARLSVVDCRPSSKLNSDDLGTLNTSCAAGYLREYSPKMLPSVS
jgi:hypothetical protein